MSSSSSTTFKSFHQAQNVIRSHSIRLSEDVIEPMFCMYCGIMFLVEKELWIHINQEHINHENMYKCTECNVSFETDSELNAHLNDKKAHPPKEVITNGNCKKVKRFTCSVCSRPYRSKTELEKHECIKQTYGFSCDVCGKKFNRRVCLQFHKERQHGNTKGFTCHRCKIAFKCPIEFKVHFDRKHAGRTTRNNGEVPALMNANVDIVKFDKGSGRNLNDISGDVEEDEDDDDENDDEDDDDYIDNNSSDDEHRTNKKGSQSIKKVRKSDNNDNSSVNSDEISRHLDSVSVFGNDDKVFTCSACDESRPSFKTRFELVRHQNDDHTLEELENDPVYKDVKEKNIQCTYSKCGKYFLRNIGLSKHQQKVHGIEYVRKAISCMNDIDEKVLKKAERRVGSATIYHCDQCNKNIMTKRGYVRHIRIHTGERPFTCHVCGKQYRSNTDLTRHLRCVHDGIKNYSCDICGRCFANKGTRNDHRRTHTGERPYVCYTCGKSFPTSNSIYVHRRTHTDYFPHECSTCKKRFRRRQQLVHHERTHTGEKPHACEICGKCFGVKDEVSRHRLTHSNEKPFPCPVCGLYFGQKRYVKSHMKTHHSTQSVTVDSL